MFQIHINDQPAWVTGASRGIGRAIALDLARAGCNVALTYRGRHDDAQETADLITKMGRKAVLAPFDVTDAGATALAHEKIVNELGEIAILVNCAGVVRDGLFMMLETKDWHEVLQTNLMGYVNVTKTVLPGMLMKRAGRIINLSSVAGQKSGRGQANYAASKAAIEAMSRSLAVELGSRKITVNCIAPGVVTTDMSKDVIALAKDEILSRQLIKRFASPEEIAGWAVFLASSYGDFMTGQVITIDGGLKMP